jgi:hypothetical protein
MGETLLFTLRLFAAMPWKVASLFGEQTRLALAALKSKSHWCSCVALALLWHQPQNCLQMDQPGTAAAPGAGAISSIFAFCSKKSMTFSCASWS